MKKQLKGLLAAILCGCCTLALAAPKTIGILVPMELPAMDQIVGGYKQQLAKAYPGKVTLIIKNAQGNTDLQRAILQEFQQHNVDLIAPIGTDATQMALHMFHQKPIVAIAADMPNGKHFNNATNVLDEVSVAKQIDYIHQAMPDLKKLTLVYSADERIFKQANQVIAAGKKDHIQVQKLMIEQLPDLYSVRQHIAANSQAIFILKDETVVSGIRALVQQAQQRHIPVIASDDGSVDKGAAFALGVRESDIGKIAANQTAKILKGTPAGNIPEFKMTHYTIFINLQSAKQQGVNVAQLKQVAKKLNYTVVNE